MVDTILSMMLTDRKVAILEEIDKAILQSAGDSGSRILWGPEALADEVRKRVESANE